MCSVGFTTRAGEEMVRIPARILFAWDSGVRGQPCTSLESWGSASSLWFREDLECKLQATGAVAGATCRAAGKALCIKPEGLLRSMGVSAEAAGMPGGSGSTEKKRKRRLQEESEAEDPDGSAERQKKKRVQRDDGAGSELELDPEEWRESAENPEVEGKGKGKGRD
ncbi:hypothetical protein M422DRAFT_256195 [Sphaerobolus stellatus SS14]|uniref:Uncharacterized protein n=1 Tax=Sphaerobolus stellatus (strain SS14) TaxID=990650 RepID=A0A0C9VR30_SPHS4|nr:hypothetical protein M422DRAFT_256195 [Sphaerobolus stellatus SS14]